LQSTRNATEENLGFGRATLKAFLLDLAPGRVYPSVGLPRTPVGSYPTVSPLPQPTAAVWSLWHFPCAYARHLRASLPCGVRTFLCGKTHSDRLTSPPNSAVPSQVASSSTEPPIPPFPIYSMPPQVFLPASPDGTKGYTCISRLSPSQ